MKPDWKDAPRWANYLAMDHDGTWYWFEFEPKFDTETQNWIPKNQGFEIAAIGYAPCNSLEKRPMNTQPTNYILAENLACALSLAIDALTAQGRGDIALAEGFREVLDGYSKTNRIEVRNG